MKKLVSLFLTLTLLLTVLPFAAHAAATVEGDGTMDSPWQIGATPEDAIDAFLMKYDDVTVLLVSGEGAMMDFATPEDRPWNGKAQEVNISDNAFFDEPGITYIGKNAFAGMTGTGGGIEIPATVTAIGENAFAGSSETVVQFNGAAPDIAENAFNGVKATVYVHQWANEKMVNYGGTLDYKDLYQVRMVGHYEDNAFPDEPLLRLVREDDKDITLMYPDEEGYCFSKWTITAGAENIDKVDDLDKTPAPLQTGLPLQSFGSDYSYLVYDNSVLEYEAVHGDVELCAHFVKAPLLVTYDDGSSAWQNRYFDYLWINEETLLILDDQMMISMADGVDEADVSVLRGFEVEYLHLNDEETKAVYDSEITLTLNNVNLVGENAEFCPYRGKTTVKLVGENTVDGHFDAGDVTTFIGNGSLYMTNHYPTPLVYEDDPDESYLDFGTFEVWGAEKENAVTGFGPAKLVTYPWEAPSGETVYDTYLQLADGTDCMTLHLHRPYTILEGKKVTYEKSTAKDLTLTSDAPFFLFDSVKVDGKTVAASNYTVKEGSTKVTFKAAYLKTLALGKHTVTILSADGSATTTLEITNTPKTGEHSFLMLGMLIFATASICLAVVLRKKNETVR